MSDSLAKSVPDTFPKSEKVISVLAALLFVSAVVASLFFNGMHGEYFALAMSLLLVWLAVLSWRGIAVGRPLPSGGLLFSLVLYVVWLASTLLWNPIPYLGATYFWLLATPLFVVLAWYFAPAPEQVWRYVWPLLLLLACGLMALALYQYYELGGFPNATFINRNSFAAMLVLLMFIAVSRVLVLGRARKLLLSLLLAGICIAALVIGLIGSRGVFLCVLLGGGVLAGWAVHQKEARRRVWLSIFAIVIGVAVSNLSFVNLKGHVLSERVGGLVDPYSAGNDRFLIWGQSLAMAQDKPIAGYGLGTYWQYWPQWRDPADSTSGFWAHNDFLHLGVEAGLPAVVLLVLVHIVLLLVVWRIVRSNIDVDQKAVVVALFAGLLAVAVHAQFTFNYYMLPIVLVLSLMMAIIARVERDACGAMAWVLPRWGRYFIPLAAVLPVLYFSMIGASLLVFEDAVAKMRAGDLQGADQSFVRAQQLWGKTDMFFYTHGLLKERQLTAAPVDDVELRKVILAEGMALFDRAIENSHVRPMPYFFRGRLRVQAAELAGEDWLANAEADFKQALVYEPRYLEARMTLARILAVTNRQVEADVLLEEGMDQSYPEGGAQLLAYYQMVVAARQRAGDVEGADEVVVRHNDIVRALREAQRIEQEAGQLN